MFISKKEFRELKKIKTALWSCENVEKLDLWKIHKTLNEITKKIDKRKNRSTEDQSCYGSLLKGGEMFQVNRPFYI